MTTTTFKARLKVSLKRVKLSKMLLRKKVVVSLMAQMILMKTLERSLLLQKHPVRQLHKRSQTCQTLTNPMMIHLNQPQGHQLYRRTNLLVKSQHSWTQMIAILQTRSNHPLKFSHLLLRNRPFLTVMTAMKSQLLKRLLLHKLLLSRHRQKKRYLIVTKMMTTLNRRLNQLPSQKLQYKLPPRKNYLKIATMMTICLQSL